jgi:hypothetical protein
MAAPSTDSITEISLQCRGVNRNSVSENANRDLMYLVQKSMTNNPVFKKADLSGELTVDPANSNTFTFTLTVNLAHPLKL